MKALLIGRFQPFHLGHLKLIEYIAQTCSFLIIGVGSSQYANTYKNPFSYDERKTMITLSLKDIKPNFFEIVAIPDIHDPPNWVDHVNKLIPVYDVVITNNEFTKKLFEEKGIKTMDTPLFNRKDLSGKNIRSLIAKNKDWKSLVPVEVADFILSIDGTVRIKQLFSSD